MVVDDAHHVVAVAEVAIEEAQDVLCRLARANQDNGLVEEVALLEDQTQHVARREDQQQDEDAEEARIDSRQDKALLEDEEQQDAADHAVENGIEELAEGIQDRLHLGVDMRLRDEDEEDKGNPDVDVLCGDGVDDIPVAHPEREFLGGNDGDVVGQGKEQGAEIMLILSGQRCSPLPIAIASYFAHDKRTAFFEPVLMF